MLRGYVHPDFADVAELHRKLIPRAAPGGAAICAYHRGECVVDTWGGTRDAEGNPWEEDTICLAYSTTKGVASTLIHILVDRGLLDYDTPVSEFWPEFAQAGKRNVTLRQVMCHEAGLYDVRSLVDHARQMLDWDYMASALAAATPDHEPGAAHGYHGFTYGWLVGEVAQRVTGKPFRELLQSEIAEPLELDGLYCGLPPDQMARRARLAPVRFQGRDPDRLRTVARGMNRLFSATRLPLDLSRVAAALIPRGVHEMDFDSEEFVRVSIPSANGLFTARSLARMYAALAGGGALGGVRLISPPTLERAIRVQNRGVGRVIPFSMRWRLGYHQAATLGVRVPRGFGHFGFGGSGAWADPDRNLSVALVLTSGMGTPFGDMRIVRVGSAAARCADRS
jgi:CubicO group peptidase (beta-lactamase class C family)